MSKRKKASKAAAARSEPAPPASKASGKLAGLMGWLPYFLVGLAFAALPWANFRAFYDPRQSQTLAAGVLFFAIALVTIPVILAVAREYRRPTALDWSLMGFVAIVALSTMLGQVPTLFLRGALPFLALVSVYFAIRAAPANRFGVDAIVLGVALGALVVAGAGILQNFGIEILGYLEKDRRGKNMITSLLGNPNYVASYLAPSLFVILAGGWSKRHIVWKILSCLVVVPIGWCLLLAGGRAGWLGVATGALVATVFLIRASGRMRLGARQMALAAAVPIVTLLLIVGGIRFVSPNFDPAQRLFSVNTLHLRIFPWRLAGTLFADNPILGLGYGRFYAEIDRYTADFFEGRPDHEIYRFIPEYAQGDRPDHLHNEYLHILIEHGLLGLFAFSLVLTGGLLASWRVLQLSEADRQTRIRAAFLGGALACTLADAFWGFPLRLPMSGALFFAVLGILENSRARLDADRRRMPVSVYRRIKFTGVILAMLFACLLGSIQRFEATKERVAFSRNPDWLKAGGEALRDLESAHPYSDLSQPPPFELVDYYLNREAWRFAKEKIAELEKRTSLGASGYLQYGTICYQLGEYEEAREHYKRASLLRPGAAHILEFLAIAEVQLGELDEAEKHLHEATDEDPMRPNCYYLLAEIYRARGEQAKAADYYERAARSALQETENLMFDPAEARRLMEEIG